MSTAKEELKLRVDYDEASEAFIAEKAKRGTDKFDQKAYDKAKKKVSDLRSYWRQVREAVAEGIVGVDDDGNPIYAETETQEG